FDVGGEAGRVDVAGLADTDLRVADPAGEAGSDVGGDVVGFACFRGGGDDCGGEWVIAEPLERCRQPEHVIGRAAGGGHGVNDLGPVAGEGAGLVEGDCFDGGERFDRGAAFDYEPGTGGGTDGCEHGDRYGDRERA